MVEPAAVVKLLAWTYLLEVRMKCDQDVLVTTYTADPASPQFDSG